LNLFICVACVSFFLLFAGTVSVVGLSLALPFDQYYEIMISFELIYQPAIYAAAVTTLIAYENRRQRSTDVIHSDQQDTIEHISGLQKLWGDERSRACFSTPELDESEELRVPFLRARGANLDPFRLNVPEKLKGFNFSADSFISLSMRCTFAS
uniref:PhoLip_ATPase_C domain-containing protein n=1 Tax=Gongylonema pulchrum TaxID=637853 RepID=A0A183D329_9BILA